MDGAKKPIACKRNCSVSAETDQLLRLTKGSGCRLETPSSEKPLPALRSALRSQSWHTQDNFCFPYPLENRPAMRPSEPRSFLRSAFRFRPSMNPDALGPWALNPRELCPNSGLPLRTPWQLPGARRSASRLRSQPAGRVQKVHMGFPKLRRTQNKQNIFCFFFAVPLFSATTTWHW